MNNLASFLNKFKILIKEDGDLKEKIKASIKNNTGFALNINNISIKNKTVLIKEKPHLKNEVFIKKDKILKELGGLISDIH